MVDHFFETVTRKSGNSISKTLTGAEDEATHFLAAATKDSAKMNAHNSTGFKDFYLKAKAAVCLICAIFASSAKQAHEQIDSPETRERLSRGELQRPHVCTLLVRHDGSLGEFLN